MSIVKSLVLPHAFISHGFIITLHQCAQCIILYTSVYIYKQSDSYEDHYSPLNEATISYAQLLEKVKELLLIAHTQ